MGSWLGTPMPRWYALVVTVSSVALLALAGVLYTNYSLGEADKTERENDRRWCQLLVTLDDAYSTVPPTSALGRRVADAIHALRTDLEC